MKAQLEEKATQKQTTASAASAVTTLITKDGKTKINGPEPMPRPKPVRERTYSPTLKPRPTTEKGAEEKSQV